MSQGQARVIYTLKDLSTFVDNIPVGYVSMVITAERGPIADPQVITSWEQYQRVFGNKVSWSDDPLVCEMALKQGAKLVLTRTANYSDISDSTTLTASGSQAIIYDQGATVSGGTASGTLQFDAINEGSWGDNVRLEFFDSDFNPGEKFDCRVTLSTQSNMTEYWSDLSMDSSDDRYVVNVINGGSGKRSQLVEVTDLSSSNASPYNIPALTISGAYTSLSGGLNGNDLTDADYYGDDSSLTGLYALNKSPVQSIDIMIPGTTSVTVAQNLATYCENERGGKAIGYVMVPDGLTPAQAVSWRKGEGSYSHEAFNSERLVITYGRPLVYDSRDDTQKYISNLGHFASVLSRTDDRYGPQYAPAGPKRGVVDLVLGIDNDPGYYSGYADMFAEQGINYLTMNRNKGIEGAMFWEQRTSLRSASAFRELNVVRFLTWMHLELLPTLNSYLMDINDPITWREIHRTLEPALEDYKRKRAIYDYVLQTDRDAFFDNGELINAAINTGQDIDRGIYNLRILVQPTRAIYYIQIDVGITKTGEKFDAYTQLRELPGWIRS